MIVTLLKGPMPYVGVLADPEGGFPHVFAFGRLLIVVIVFPLVLVAALNPNSASSAANAA